MTFTNLIAHKYTSISTHITERGLHGPLTLSWLLSSIDEKKNKKIINLNTTITNFMSQK